MTAMAFLPRPRARAAAIALAALLAVAGCQPGGTSGPPGSQPAATDTSPGTACATSPIPGSDPEGWGPPAQAPQVIPVLINSAGTVTCGDNRILFTLVDKDQRPIGAPDRTASVAFYDLGSDPSKVVASGDGTFVWAIEGSVGIYVMHASFPKAGRYGAEVTTAAAGGSPETIRLTFDVQPDSPIIRVGDKAPASTNPTLADVGGDVAKISTDSTPDPALYQASVDKVLAAGKPFAVIFATPKFCQTAQCGPTLDRIKPFVAKYPSITFINIEPYKLKFENGSLQADLADNELQPVAATEAWHLVNEPTVYVVDRTGVVRGNFDLIFSDAELTAALEAVK
jgi:hypothetical protein